MLELKNTYYVMRHGESKANVAGIIVSNPENGILSEYGLTEQGSKQVQESVQNSPIDADTIIVSSDFSRAYESAQVAQKTLEADDVQTSEKLRERFFGEWEKTSNANYELIWTEDASGSENTKNVESAENVLSRAMSLIDKLEHQYSDKNILLVSHGDTLQILMTGFAGIDPKNHRDIDHLHTAEIRKL